MISYLWYKKCLDRFVESEHPRDEGGKFTDKDQDNYTEVSPEQHKSNLEKINSIANHLKQQGVKVKNVSATKYGSLYLKAYLPMKNGYGWADISLRDHPSSSKFDLLLPTNTTKEDFIKEFETVKKVFAKNDKILQAQQELRKGQYKHSN